MLLIYEDEESLGFMFMKSHYKYTVLNKCTSLILECRVMSLGEGHKNSKAETEL